MVLGGLVEEPMPYKPLIRTNDYELDMVLRENDTWTISPSKKATLQHIMDLHDLPFLPCRLSPYSPSIQPTTTRLEPSACLHHVHDLDGISIRAGVLIMSLCCFWTCMSWQMYFLGIYRSWTVGYVSREKKRAKRWIDTLMLAVVVICTVRYLMKQNSECCLKINRFDTYINFNDLFMLRTSSPTKVTVSEHPHGWCHALSVIMTPLQYIFRRFYGLPFRYGSTGVGTNLGWYDRLRSLLARQPHTWWFLP